MMRLPPPTACAAAAGLLLAAAFPPLDLPWLALAAPAPLLGALATARPGRALWLGWVFGTAAFTLPVWGSIEEGARRYFDLPPPAAMVLAVVIPQLTAVPFAAGFAWTASLVSRRASAWWRPFALAAGWAGWETLRAALGHGNPWILLGHIAWAWPLVIQPASLAGVAGISFLLVLPSATVVEMMRERDPRRRLGALAGCAGLLLVVAAWSTWALRRWEDLPSDTLAVALVQPAVPARWRSSIAQVPASLRRHEVLTRQVAADRPELVVWPENALGAVLPANESLLKRAAAVLPPGAWLLLGAPYARAEAGRVVKHNSAWVVAPGGRISGRYDKVRLTPLAESPVRPRRLGKWIGLRGASFYAPGRSLEPLEVAGTRAGTMICYEAIFSWLGRRLVREGAEVLINLSNDDWFGNRAAVDQHFRAALFRAVELRRSLVRVTNSGISAVVLPSGRIAAHLTAGRADAQVVQVPVVSATTPYARIGDAFGWLCLAMALLAALAQRGR